MSGYTVAPHSRGHGQCGHREIPRPDRCDVETIRRQIRDPRWRRRSTLDRHDVAMRIVCAELHNGLVRRGAIPGPRARDQGTRSSPRAPATRLRVATRKGQVLIGSGQSEQWRQPLSGEAARDRGTVGGLTQFLSSTARNPLIPEWRDVRVVEGARLEIESGRAQ